MFQSFYNNSVHDQTKSLFLSIILKTTFSQLHLTLIFNIITAPQLPEFELNAA
ncbi:hypothetical protein Hanom_Chr13g01218901 [Helianthus anomalus]